MLKEGRTLTVRRALGVLVAVTALVASACAGVSSPPESSTTGESAPSTTVPDAKPGPPWTTGITWAWVLAGGAIPNAAVDVVDVDLVETPAAEVHWVESNGIRTVCYISVGTFEDGRPDAGDYPEEILGNTWDEWDERYVDIRRLDVLGPILEARLDLCADKGFSAVEPDNLDTYGADTGFDLTASDAIGFARWIADEAHRRGLAVAQKNAPELSKDLVDSFDFAITEDCFDDGWCTEMAPYGEAEKAILDAEYTDRMDSLSLDVCAQASDLGISVLLADRPLTENFQRCP